MSLPSGPDMSTVQNIINFIACNFTQSDASYNMCSSMLPLKVLNIHVVQVAQCTLSEPRDETMRWLLTVRGLLWQVPIILL